MFVKSNAPLDGAAWVAYSHDGSGTPESMVQTQPINATPEQLVLMGVTTAADPVVPPAPPAVPQIISDRQFFQQLAIQGVITVDEALAAVGPGTLPASLVTLVASLPAGNGTPSDPANQQFPANMLLKGATQFDRQHPMVPVLGAAFGWSSDQLDTLWRAASLL